MTKYVVVFVEGETEEELYTSFIIPKIRENMLEGKLKCNVKVINVRGVGGFKKDSIMKFKKLKKDNPDKTFIVALCYDTDVFEIASKPPINWNDVENKIRNEGASKVIRVKAKKSVEDWLLYDLEGMCKWLRISNTSKPSGKNGYEKINSLFRKNNKTYIKGKKVEGLLQRLNIEKIINSVSNELEPLIDELQN